MSNYQKTLQLVCNANNKLANNSYSISLGNLGKESFIAMSLKSCCFRNVFYNVTLDNNKFYYSLAGIDSSINIDIGFYSVSQLLDILITEIKAIFLSSGIIPLPTLDEFKYNSITAKCNIIVNGNGVLTPFELLGSNVNSINFLLGNINNVLLDTLTPVSYIFESLVSLGGLDSVSLVSQNLASNSAIANSEEKDSSNGRNFDLIRTLHIDQPFGGLIIYEAQNLLEETIVSNNILNFSNLKIALTTTKGEILDLYNSEMTLQIICWIKNPR